MELKNIILESLNKNPLGVKEALVNELNSRIKQKLSLENEENPMTLAAYEKNKSILKNSNRSPV